MVENIAGYILTGGKNRRMGGEKKLFLSLDGKSFLERIREAMKDFSVIYLSVETKEPYEGVGLPLIEDEYFAIGPMGGIYSGLRNCQEEALFVVACDMPLLNQQTVEKICRAYEQEKRTVVVKAQNRLHPLLGIYTKETLPAFQKLIQEKDYRMMNLLKRIDYAEIMLEEEANALMNINSREDYGCLKEMCEKRTM